MRLLNALKSRPNFFKATNNRMPTPFCTLSTIHEENLGRYGAGGYHPVRIGDEFKHGTYRVVSKLGYGLYSTVWLVLNKETNHHVALKILTTDSIGGQKGTFELEILHRINQKSKERLTGGPDNILGLLDEFRHQGPNGEHACLVVEAMGPNLAQYRKLFPRSRIPVPVMKKISKQLLSAMVFLHDSCEVIHTDIKPQNILLETPGIRETLQHAPSSVLEQHASPPDPKRPYYMESGQITLAGEDLSLPENISVKLADFGTSSWFDRHLTEWIQPEKLRAPEVILKAKWDHEVDIWNLGLVIWELVLGQLVFDGQATATAPYTSEAHLAQMRSILGPMPKSLLDRAAGSDRFYDSEGNLLQGPSFPTFTLKKLCEGANVADLNIDQFLEFMKGMLQLEPRARLNANQLMEAKWLQDGS